MGSNHNRAGVVQMYWITHKMAVYKQNMLQEYLNIYQNEFSWFIP